MRICSICGTQLTDDMAFCINCGNTLETQPQYQQPAVRTPVVMQPAANEYNYYDQPVCEDPSMVETVNACIKKAKTALSLSIVSLVVPPAFIIIALLFCWCAIIPFLNFFYWFFIGFFGTISITGSIACLILAFVTRASIKKLPEVSPDSVNYRLYEQYQEALKKANTSKILNFIVFGVLGAIIATILVLAVLGIVFVAVYFVIMLALVPASSLGSYYY